MGDLSFAQTYILSNKVKSKLTKDAANPNASLRNLVVQVNMLDNLMDYIANENKRRSEKREQERKNHVSFELPERGRSSERNENTMVTEYEVNSDSDSDYDSYSGSDSDEDEDEDDYYYSDEDDEDEASLKTATVMELGSNYKQLPSIDLSEIQNLKAIEEDEEEDLLSSSTEDFEELEESISEMPDLTYSISLTDDEDFESHSNYIHTPKHKHNPVLQFDNNEKSNTVTNPNSGYVGPALLQNNQYRNGEFSLGSLF